MSDSQVANTASQQRNSILTLIYNLLKTGVIVQPIPTVYTVAALPATAATGQWAWASNGRKIGEGAGAGTGCPVYWNAATSQWFTYSRDAVVAA